MSALTRPPAVAALASTLLLASGGCGPTTPEPPAAVFSLEEATIADITAAFDAGALSCRELVQLYLDRIAAYDDDGPRLNSIITINPRAINTARALDEERVSSGPRGPLHCIPVLLKDNIDTHDMPTSNGSVILKDAIAPDDAYITRALREAGALILGKASLGEFAGGNSYNSVDGQTLNPYNEVVRWTLWSFRTTPASRRRSEIRPSPPTIQPTCRQATSEVPRRWPGTAPLAFRALSSRWGSDHRVCR